MSMVRPLSGCEATPAPGSYSSQGRARRPEPPHHLPLPGVDLLQGPDPLLRHPAPDHPVASRRGPPEADPTGSRGPRALGDDAALALRLEPRAEHVAPAQPEVRA